MSSEDAQLKVITQEQLSKKNSKEDPWLAIGGRVYAVKDYMPEHPGGAEVLFEKAGSDATPDFIQIGHGSNARELMKKYCVGKLEGAELMSDEELAGKSGGEGSKWLIFAILAVVIAYFYMNKYRKSIEGQ
eukprot:TRINITY_DN67329_c0_g1_i1.p2 TRINITY_DN67329_c0_g1~~TRINITY_DN67329_c0_g1_i1.p2  ORF type:complete len:131 (+),score=69.05 TRINITY_DN67329_c0_g1_i1:74-466(+)